MLPGGDGNVLGGGLGYTDVCVCSNSGNALKFCVFHLYVNFISNQRKYKQILNSN